VSYRAIYSIKHVQGTQPIGVPEVPISNAMQALSTGKGIMGYERRMNFKK